MLLRNVERAARNLKGVIYKTPLLQNHGLSRACDATVLLKRKDPQVVRSYKIRGAYHKMSTLPPIEGEREIVCASADNHAQGVAYACQLLGLKAYIFMPAQTPAQKVDKVRAAKYQGLKHYFMVTFNQAPGALRHFVNNVLHEGGDIIHFQYIKKNNKEKGPVFVGIEVKRPHDVEAIK